jgi:hypothetical protein
MDTAKPDSAIPPEIMADLEEVARQAATGGVRDPELLRRVTERAEPVRQELFERYGLLDIAVPLIREIREEE